MQTIFRNQYFILPLLLLALLLSIWFWKGPINGHGGIPVFGRIEIPLEPFYQDDPHWSQDILGKSTDTIGSAGCALSSAAMALRFYGVDLDPQQLNDYLTKYDGYEGVAWIKWDVAATFPPNKNLLTILTADHQEQGDTQHPFCLQPTSRLAMYQERLKRYDELLRVHDAEATLTFQLALEHWNNSIVMHRYEGLPSYGLIDWNLLNGNPVIIRIRRPTGKTHFVVLVGKQGFDYLVSDPGPKGRKGVYPYCELKLPIDGLRFYKKR